MTSIILGWLLFLILFVFDIFSSSDKRLYTLLLESETQSHVQTEAHNQQNHQPCKSPGTFLSSLSRERSKSTFSLFSLKMDGFQRHFDSQLLAYGKQTILNLVKILISPGVI